MRCSTNRMNLNHPICRRPWIPVTARLTGRCRPGRPSRRPLLPRRQPRPGDITTTNRPRISLRSASELAAVIGPMQQRLPLTLPAHYISRLAIHLQLAHVPSYRLPALYLPCVLVRQAPAQIIPAIPLEPAARIMRIYPALLAPDGERLAGINAKPVQACVPAFRGKFRSDEPVTGKFAPAVGHVFATENTQAQHFRR